MATDVVMPRLSDSMEEGTVLKWLKAPGDEVARGESLVEIETDKANMTYESDTDGVLIEILAEEGDTLEIGSVIARIGESSEVVERDGSSDSQGGAEAKDDAEGGATSDTEADADGAKEGEPPGEEAGGAKTREPESAAAGGGRQRAPVATPTAAERDEPGTNGDGGRVKASPVARRMAHELGVELRRLEGSGPGGRIVKADVQAAAKDAPAVSDAEPTPEQAPTPAPAASRAPAAGAKGEAEIVELSRLQQTVTRRMAESKATAPDFALSLTVDMSDAVTLRARLKEVADPVPSFNDMIVKAAAIALREHPRVNGAYRDGKWELYERVNVGVAVAAQDALVVPTVFDADTKSLGQIARDARAVIERVRDQQITPPELAGGTFTVSNLGMYGIEHFTAIINPPQACILTVGALAKQPAVDDRGRVVARDQLTLTLVCDHRILYGADGAKFLARVKALLEQPLSLAL